MESSFFALIVALYFAIFAPIAAAGKVTSPNNVPKNAILLSKVESLTFRDGKMTTARRVSPVSQLNCVGPKNICKLYNVDVMRCTNEGADYDAENIQWACRADLPEEFKLGGTDVSCEGYASSDDPYVLKGSCGVDYRLLLTDKGEEKFGSGRRGSDPYADDSGEGGGSTVAKVIFFVIFGGVLLTIIFKMLEACGRNPPRLGGGDARPPWYGGGGAGDDDNDPPPPYDSHFNQSRKPKTYGTSSRTGTAGPSRTAGQQQNQGWRPGPWTAAAAGAGLGYAFGRGGNRTQTQPRDTMQRPGAGFFGGGGGGYGGGAGPSNSRSNSSSSFSSSRHESTGFGGTSRRSRVDADSNGRSTSSVTTGPDDDELQNGLNPESTWGGWRGIFSSPATSTSRWNTESVPATLGALVTRTFYVAYPVLVSAVFWIDALVSKCIHIVRVLVNLLWVTLQNLPELHISTNNMQATTASDTAPISGERSPSPPLTPTRYSPRPSPEPQPRPAQVQIPRAASQPAPQSESASSQQQHTRSPAEPPAESLAESSVESPAGPTAGSPSSQGPVRDRAAKSPNHHTPLTDPRAAEPSARKPTSNPIPNPATPLLESVPPQPPSQSTADQSNAIHPPTTPIFTLTPPSTLTLTATFPTPSTTSITTTIDLNSHLTNDHGTFRWKTDGNAFASARNVKLVDGGNVLEAELDNGCGYWRSSRIVLGERVRCVDGKLAVVDEEEEGHESERWDSGTDNSHRDGDSRSESVSPTPSEGTSGQP
ncbi:hypothetical protein OHC33_004652 [Knufia fluminis]|uniref:Store-operated calcium entry-associated regulatory factor n=1 Tax=Knufia fluminis TaxID=191047 RepID=A0AAN8I848_9EURO|nr:hypothetical protein OHC33_004652 [Knufia fluminis]